MRHAEYVCRNPAFASEVEQAGNDAGRLLQRLSVASDRNVKRFLVRKFLNSPQAKLHYLFRSVTRCKALHRFPPETLRAQSETLNAFGHEPEPVGYYRTPATAMQRARTITVYGPRNKARQKMVLAVLKAIHQSRHDQYTISGGVPKALQALEQDFRDGYTYAVERDISRFYQRVRLEGLASILRPLPRGVVEHVIWDGRSDDQTDIDELSTGVSDDGLLPLRGLPQGSACSPIAAEMVVANLLAGMSHDLRYRAYADNVIILGRTYDAVAAASEQLEDLATASIAGPLRLKPAGEIFNLGSDHFRFLGYDGIHRPLIAPSRIEWTPKHEKLETIEGIIQRPDVTPQELINALKWCQAAANAYPLWDAGRTWAVEAQCALHARLAYQMRGNMARYPHCRIIFNYWRDTPELPGELQLLLPEAHPYEQSGRQAVLDIMTPWVERIFPDLHPRDTTTIDYSRILSR
ncbi:hypothetical protein I6F11_13860 [Ensifer sp. NBAIM29]|nr:hypothetical protein [Ensifer sp. NBAIM29]